MKKIILIFNIILLFNSINIFATEHIVVNSEMNYSNQYFQNYLQNGTSSDYGGVFYVKTSSGKLTLTSVKFLNNEISTSNYYSNVVGGGALSNIGGTVVISGNSEFSSNISSGHTAYGGAIYNDGSLYSYAYLTIGNSINFINNKIVNNTPNEGAADGGAIFNRSSNMTTKDSVIFNGNNIIGNFFSANGGAIFSSGSDSKIEIGTNNKFISNIVNTSAYNGKAYGGAIYNAFSNIDIDKGIIFDSNIAEAEQGYADGGAIYNDGVVTIKDGAKFINNSVAGNIAYGGAIYNKGTLNLIANTENVEFTGNTANGISNSICNIGTLNLWASDNASIVFNDRLTTLKNTETTITLNINQSSGTLSTTGKIILNEDMSGYGGKINLYDGEIELTNKGVFFNSETLNLSKGILNVENNKIDSIYTKNFYSTANTDLMIDVNLKNNTSDEFLIENYVTGNINLTSINILDINSNKNSGTITLFTNELSPTINILATTYYNWTEYIFSNSSISGVLNWRKGNTKSLKEIINATEPLIKSVSVDQTTIVNDNIGTLGGNQLTINGNGNEIIGNNVDGIFIDTGKILNINDVEELSGFSNIYGAVTNEGILNITDSKFFNNNGQADIINNGTLTLYGDNNSFEKGVIGNGTFVIENVFINDSTINQNAIKINNELINNSQIMAENVYITGQFKLGQTGNFYNATNSILYNAAQIDLQNNKIQQHNFGNLTINSGTVNLSIDVDLKEKTIDTISATTFTGNGKINISNINVTQDMEQKDANIFFADNKLKQIVSTNLKVAFSPIYEYDVIYNTVNGSLNFVKKSNNPMAFENIVSNQIGEYITQVNVVEQVLTNIDKQMNVVRNSKNNGNLYVSNSNVIFKEKNSIEQGLWLRPYAVSETIIVDDMDIKNDAYGTLGGLDLQISNSILASFYIGYTTSKQSYEEIDINQSGYLLGLTGSYITENYYLALTANAMFKKADAQNMFGTDNIENNSYTLAGKTGIDVKLGSKLTLQPNLLLMYSMINTADYVNSQNKKITSDTATNLHIEPSLKLMLNLENQFTPYAIISMAFNSNSSKVMMEDIVLPEKEIGSYSDLGIGFEKNWNSWNLYLQGTGRFGARQGFGVFGGLKYKFGKANDKISKQLKKKIKNEKNVTDFETEQLEKELEKEQKELEEMEKEND